MVEPEKLQKYSLFGGLLADQISQILPNVTDELFSNGEIIIAEGKPNDKIYFILEGRVSVAKNGILLTELGEGSTFGEMEVLDVMPSAATITAIGNIKTVTISNKALREIYKTDIHCFSLMMMNLARDLSRHLRIMDEKAAGEKPLSI